VNRRSENAMSAVRSWIAIIAITGSALATAGCGSKPVPVKGRVTLDDKPLANASVLFIAQEPGGRDASGYTDANGVFELTTLRPQDGALPGSYKVTIHCSAAVDVPAGARSPADVQRAKAKVTPSRTESIVILPIYSQPDQTVLSQRVPPEGEVRFDLKSKP
jgi:hypothetical protein